MKASRKLFFLKFSVIFIICLGLATSNFQPALAVTAESGVIKGEQPKIIFTAGDEEYEYSLKELALELIEGESGRYTICRNPSWLTYQLYQLSLKVKKLPVDTIFFLDDRRKSEFFLDMEGRELDLAALIVQLGNPAPYQEVYPLPLKSIRPLENMDVFLNNIPDVLWAKYTTNLANIPDRTENVRIASVELNGLVIAPGQTLSFNEIVGPREKARGYKEAKIIVGGKFESGMGGGVCQVSSTLYNTLLLAGLEIVERHNHSVIIAYVPLGRDATVVYGTKDLKIKNNTSSYLLLKTELSGLKLTMEIYGQGQCPYSEIKIYTNILKTIPHEERIIYDDSLIYPETKVLEKGTKGYISETLRVFSTEEKTWEEILSKDYYSPQNKVLALSISKDN